MGPRGESRSFDTAWLATGAGGCWAVDGAPSTRPSPRQDRPRRGQVGPRFQGEGPRGSLFYADFLVGRAIFWSRLWQCCRHLRRWFHSDLSPGNTIISREIQSSFLIPKWPVLPAALGWRCARTKCREKHGAPRLGGKMEVRGDRVLLVDKAKQLFA